MNYGKQPKPRRWDSVSDPKYVITAEADRETYDWLSRNTVEQGMTIRRWVGLKLILHKAFEDWERLKGEGKRHENAGFQRNHATYLEGRTRLSGSTRGRGLLSAPSTPKSLECVSDREGEPLIGKSSRKRRPVQPQDDNAFVPSVGILVQHSDGRRVKLVLLSDMPRTGPRGRRGPGGG